jgi:glycogen synthase
VKILLTTDTVGGVWTYALELARALGPRGIHVTLATMGNLLDPQQRKEVASIPGLGFHQSNFKLEWMHDPWDDVRKAGDWLLRLERSIHPDVVHLNGYAHAALPWKAPVLVVGHSCVLSWWEAVKGEPAPQEWERYRQEVKRGLQAADLVLAPTPAMLAALARLYGPLVKAQVVANGRDPALLAPEAKEPFIFSAGRLWDEAKNVAALEQIAPLLPWPVYLVGETRHPDHGPETSRPPEDSMDSGRNVRRLGRVPADVVVSWLRRASIYALPARYEPFGLSALEAAFAGCALVLGDIPSLREVWGDAALFVPPNDTEALRETLCRLIADPAERESMAHRARERAFEYTPERMAAGYLAAYRFLTSSSPQPPEAEPEPEEMEEPVCVS